MVITTKLAENLKAYLEGNLNVKVAAVEVAAGVTLKISNCFSSAGAIRSRFHGITACW